MLTVNIFTIFLILLLLKLGTTYVETKFLFLFIGLILLLTILYKYNQIKFDIPLITDPNKNETFENKKKQLLFYVTNFKNDFNFETKLQIINHVNNFNNNASTIFYNKLKLCEYYMDIIYSQKTDIINLANSLIITIKNYENYNFFNQYIQDINNCMNDIIGLLNSSCLTYQNKHFSTYDKNNYNNSFYFTI